MRLCAVFSVVKSAVDLSFMIMRRTVCFTSSFFVMTVAVTWRVLCVCSMKRLASRSRRKTRGVREDLRSLRHLSHRILFSSKRMTNQLALSQSKSAQTLRFLQPRSLQEAPSKQACLQRTSYISRAIRDLNCNLKLLESLAHKLVSHRTRIRMFQD